MNRIPAVLIAALIPFSAMAAHHSSADAEVRDAVKSFNSAYAGNDVEAYFSHYTDDATLYFFGARQKVSAYHGEWAEMVDAGGAVEKNALSDLQVQVMPSGDVAIATYFVDNRTRAPDGKTTTVRAFETDVWAKIGGVWKVVSLHYTEIPPE